jgi:glutathione S-transferase
MAGKRLLVHSFFLIALPVIVAYYGFSTAGAIALVLVTLLWRAGITLSVLLYPPVVPDLELETIPISHYAEKVRWCMDRLGVEYVERPVAGIFGALFTGRSVPQLKVRTGLVQSVIGNSPEILRFLWGRYSTELGEQADFLEPNKDRLDLEERIDRYGVHLQVWVYYHILNDRSLALNAWGVNDARLPAWQRALLPLMFPVFRAFLRQAFGITDEHYAKVVEKIEALLADIEARLDDGRRSILGGEDSDFVDISMASLTALWLQPVEFAAGRAKAVRIERGRCPVRMGVDIERWSDQYPLTKAFVERLYREERLSG